jgi:hypothetical protein
MSDYADFVKMSSYVGILDWLNDLSERARDEALACDGYSEELWVKAFVFQYAGFGKFDSAIKFKQAAIAAGSNGA